MYYYFFKILREKKERNVVNLVGQVVLSCDTCHVGVFGTWLKDIGPELGSYIHHNHRIDLIGPN